jgi:restriction system protein
MARGFLHGLAQIQRASMRAARAAEREADRQSRDAARAEKALQRMVVSYERDQKRLYLESRAEEVEEMNRQLGEQVADLEELLAHTLAVDNYLELDLLKRTAESPEFHPGPLSCEKSAPSEVEFLPPLPSLLRRLVPGAKQQYVRAVQEAQEKYQIASREFESQEAERKRRLAAARAEHDADVQRLHEDVIDQHRQIDNLKADLVAQKPDAIVDYFGLVLERSTYPEGFPQHAKIAFVPESKQLVIEYDLPALSAVPEVRAYKYNKTRDVISETPRPAIERRNLYSSVIAQLTLRTLHEVFEADRLQNIETVIFNGHVDSIDAATGKHARPCVVSVRSTRPVFEELQLDRVDPIACLRALNAAVSRKPDELVPIRPVLEFNMVDPRFVEEDDVLSDLDRRPNLMELTPSEFESLITNLFERMGLETRQTQASRDGGVDCVAYDPRPIFGGKVVIQAKRYKNTVGVSAVRDLFGTLQNEGASKGILVTTSGYGKAAFEFAGGKPIELLSGSHLLYLLVEHAGIEAKIVPPDDWKDPSPDVGQ